MGAIGKIKASRVNNVANVSSYVGEEGILFYNFANGVIRLSDGTTPGGVPVPYTIASVNTIGGIKAGPGANVSADGTLTIDTSGLPLSIGNLEIADTSISTLIPNTNLNLLSNGTGEVNLVGNVHIHPTINWPDDDTSPIFSVDDSGSVGVFASNVPAFSAGALNIVGSSTRTFQPITNAGGMLHITGNDNTSSRITSDAFGTGVSPVYVGRLARGNVAAPQPVQSGDVLTRFTGVGWTGTQYANTSISPIATLRIDGVAGENFSGTTQGSYWKIYTNPIGSVSAVLSANIGATGTAITGNLSVSQNITGKFTNGVRDVGTVADNGTVTIDFSADDIVVCSWGNGLNVTYTNFLPGKVVKLIAAKLAGTGTDSLSLDGITAAHTTTGSTSISGAADVTYIIELYSTGSSIAGLYAKI